MEAAMMRGLAGTVTRQEWLVAGLLFGLGLGARLLPHVANFSPLLAIAVFSGYYFRRSALAWALPLSLAVITDLLLGTYASMVVTWLSYALMGLLAQRYLHRISATGSVLASGLAAISFFVITNFAVWTEGRMYALTWQGLSACFTAAVPFFRASLLSAVLYSVVLFGVCQVVMARSFHRAGLVKE